METYLLWASVPFNRDARNLVGGIGYLGASPFLFQASCQETLLNVGLFASVCVFLCLLVRARVCVRIVCESFGVPMMITCTDTHTNADACVHTHILKCTLFTRPSVKLADPCE